MPKRVTAGDSVQISIRVDPTVQERADALIAHVRQRTGLAAVRTDVFREAIMRGIATLEMERDARKTKR